MENAHHFQNCLLKKNKKHRNKKKTNKQKNEKKNRKNERFEFPNFVLSTVTRFVY